ncbi:hypothetical protein P5V15_007187 [Pogonomyrmex californicus]
MMAGCCRLYLFVIYLLLQEANDIFEPRVEENLFRPINVIVKASNSDKMAAGIYTHFNCFFYNYFNNLIKFNVINVINYCFVQIILYLKKFSDTVLLLKSNINLHQRINIIKSQYLIHNKLPSPRYYNLFKYSWFKSGHINERSKKFKNPVKLVLKKF